MISGFIITLLIAREEKQTGRLSLSGFYRRRALRIIPPFWCYLAVIGLLGYCGVLSVTVPGDIVRPGMFLMRLPFGPKTMAHQVLHSWSLSVEEQFYLMWPIAFVMLTARWRAILVAMVILAGPFLRVWLYEHPRQWELSWTILAHGDMLAWGCLLALAAEHRPEVIQAIVGWRPTIGRLLAVIVIQFAPWYFWTAYVKRCPPLSQLALSMSAQAFAIAYLIASLTIIRRGLMYRLLNFKLLVAIGLISYSVYIWQGLFLSDAPSSHRWTSWPINIICVLATSTASYFLVERPARSLQRRSIFSDVWRRPANVS